MSLREALALLFIVSSLVSSPPEATVEALDSSWYTPKTDRGEVLPTKVMVGNCFLCHAYWVGIPDPQVVRPRFAHHVIKLEHGANDRCFNCHLIQDRNKYTANDGSGIMHTNVEELCARCHGLIFNDWRAGTQLATVGTHWPMSRAFNKEELDTVMRAGTCMGCHQNMSQKELWEKISTEGKLDPAKHIEMMNNMIKILAEQGIKPAEAQP